ncbi:MAG: prefoldin subunit beta [Sulfolobaceae archaeon]
MTEQVPPELQTQIVKLQQLQEQLNRLLAEKSIIDSELREINSILEELSKLPQDVTIYEIIGNLLVRKERSNVEKDLNERKELLELRAKVYQRNESNLRRQLEEVQKKVNELMAKYYPQLKGGGTSAPQKA